MSNVLYETARGIEIIPLADKLLDDNKIFIIETICRETCDEVIKKLLYLNSKSDVEKIEIYIDSDGGSVQAGLVLFDVIKMLNKPVRTIAFSAASMAAILFLAGDERLMMNNSRVMIHDPCFGGNYDIAGKKPHEIKAELDELNKCRTKLLNIIAESTGQSIKTIGKLTKDDNFFDISEAMKYGICTGLYNLNERGDN